MRDWIKNYGVVAVLSIGLIGGLFFWAVSTQVEAQTSSLQADNEVFKVRLETIQSDIDALKKVQEQTDKRLRRLEDGQEDLQTKVSALQQGQLDILRAIRKIPTK